MACDSPSHFHCCESLEPSFRKTAPKTRTPMASSGRAPRFPFRVRTRQYLAGAFLLMLLGSTARAVLMAQSTNGTVPGVLRSYTTIYSVGIEWDISGDADHDAT